MYLFEQCRRLLQSTPDMLIQAQMPCDENSRHVDVLCFTKPQTHQAAGHVDPSVDVPEMDSAVQPGALESDAENAEDDASDKSSRSKNILDDTEDQGLLDADDAGNDDAAETTEPSSNGAVQPNDTAADAAQPAQEPSSNDAVQPNENSNDAAQPEQDPEAWEESLDITALETTTSAHDDWLHRGPFLFDMDFHTYVRFTARKPRAKEHKVSDVKCSGFLAEIPSPGRPHHRICRTTRSHLPFYPTCPSFRVPDLLSAADVARRCL